MNFDTPLPGAVLFDMDGVLVDSNPYHLQKWADLLNAHNIPFDPAELPEQILGHRNDHAFRFFFGPSLSAAETARLSDELEENFRRAFAPHAKAPAGLVALIEACHKASLPMAVVSSAELANVEFIVDALKLRPYFRFLISGMEVTHPKPDPEIYLKAAARIGVPPARCVAFEDSFVGIQSVKDAGMKCVAIGSTFPMRDLRERTGADWVAKGFEEVTLPLLEGLWNHSAGGAR